MVDLQILEINKDVVMFNQYFSHQLFINRLVLIYFDLMLHLFFMVFMVTFFAYLYHFAKQLNHVIHLRIIDLVRINGCLTAASSFFFSLKFLTFFKIFWQLCIIYLYQA